MRKYLIIGAALLLAPSVNFAQEYLPDAARIQSVVNYLASNKLKGRGTDEKGGIKAGKFVEKQFKKLGLAAGGDQGNYYQDFKFDKNAHKDIPSRNVLGFLDNHAAKTIIIGAHYDHLGRAALFDGKYPIGEIHNGADDNASGIAGLLELARYYTKNNEQEPFNFLFIAFGGEELGLQGSKYFVNHPAIALDKVHFMLNMDMIGRYNPSRGVGIGGYGTAAQWPEIFKNVSSDTIKFFTDKAGKGGSDHHSFYMKNVPVIFLHTGGHDDYHKPTDDADKLMAKEEAGILDIGIQIINGAMKFDSLTFMETE
ncbi:peptidase M28 [Chitinophaga caeni]|uniref:Peptidase M28 n=1 Tax=Chitinophaga caeni TaxID=2029983 RepID=A0A291R098_9BACT|nr:M20/M25/M40 family metallo-hydrolase [Chitinophaga caeni]ATL49618.1 peptidase M28 [Chitinophaga caeni]